MDKGASNLGESDKPVKFDQVKISKNESKKKRSLDFGFLHLKKKIAPAHKDLKPQKIAISKPKKVKRNAKTFYIAALGILILVFFASLFTGTKTYNILRLIISLRSENILVGFQNSAELRPTGGFWGSFAYLRIGRNLTDSTLYFETNPYKKDNPLLKETNVPLPRPMAETWPDRPQSFVNANWPFDFPTAAKTIEWYLGQGWELDSDAVIGISSLSIIDLLKLTGPIEMPNNEILTSENFTEFMSKKIDVEYWQNPQNLKINEPKTLLLETAPRIIEKAKQLSKYQLYRFMLQQMEKGHVLAYFNAQDQQRLAEKIGISGSSLPYKSDYLSINNANLNGNKSSLNVSQTIKYSNKVEEAQILSNVEIIRNHLAGRWPEDAPNRNYTRVIVPLGSKIKSAFLGGQDITNQVETNEEMDKTTFGFWFITAPGETKSASLTYDLPIKKERIDNYQLIYQKQPGTNADWVEINTLGQKLFEGINEKSVLILP